MILAIGAVFLAILLLPPLIFHYVFKNGVNASASPKLSVLEYLLVSAVVALMIHSLSIYLFRWEHLDPGFLLRLATGTMTEKYIDERKDYLPQYIVGFSMYTFVVCAVSAAMGLLFQKLVTWRWLRMRMRKYRNVSVKAPLFRYFSHWWYVFRANEYDENRFGFLGEEKPLIYVDVLVDSKDAAVLYSGLLINFVTNGDELLRLYLQDPSKRLFSTKVDDKSAPTLIEGTEVLIEGHFFCIEYRDIINLNVRFVKSFSSPQAKQSVNRPLIDASGANNVSPPQTNGGAHEPGQTMY